MKIMAPAGDFERLEAAIKAGADEVYMGVAGFGARRFAKNFTVEEYADAIDYAHKRGVDVHLTFNTMLADAELDQVYPGMKRLYEAGLDAVIVQDFGVVRWFQENFPEISLCASTQLSPASALELNWYEANGFTRAVLARELTLDELKSIRAQTKLEMEVFVSGALCLGCSGKCYLSSFIGGRSGNRGMCAQPCRQPYRVLNSRNDREPELDVEQSAQISESERADLTNSYCLSLKDQLQGREEIKALIDLGVDSVKIEGRMKSPAYAYETTRYYRDLVDSITGVSRAKSDARLSIKKSAEERARESKSDDPLPKEDDERRRFQIASLFNRGYDKGYYHEPDPAIINARYASNFGVEIGRVRRDAVLLSQPIVNGDGVFFVDANARKLGGLNVSGARRVDPTNSRRSTVVEKALPGDVVKFHEPIPLGAVALYRSYDHALNKEIESLLARVRRREPIAAKIVAKVGEKMRLELSTPRAAAFVVSEKPLEPARARGLDRESLRESLDRFGETTFYLDSFDAEIDADAFAPKSLVNQLRQECVVKLESAIIESYRRVAPTRSADDVERAELRQDRNSTFGAYRTAREKRLDLTDAPYVKTTKEYLPRIAAAVRTATQYEACRSFGVEKIYFEPNPIQYENRFLFQTSSKFAPIAGSLAEAILLEKRGEPYAIDRYFNVGSARAVLDLAERFPRAKTIYLSPEISDRAVDEIAATLKRLGEKRPDVKLGINVYGRLLGMNAQKTLFNEPVVSALNGDDKKIVIEKISARNAAADGEFADSFDVDATKRKGAELDPEPGSLVYIAEPLDLIDAIPWLVQSGIDELRLDFTREKFAETNRVLERAATGGFGRFHTFSYGYTRDGVY